MTDILRADTSRSGRPLEEVLEFHGLHIQQFAGKTILDLGCGFSDLGGDLQRAGIEAQVIGIDANPRQIETAQLKNPLTSYRLADIGGRLDVEDESVDMVLATYSLPMWARDARQISTFFSESKRALKIGGLLSDYPLMVASPIDHKSPSNNLDDLNVKSMRRTLKWEAARIKWSPNWMSTSDDDQLLQVIKLG